MIVKTNVDYKFSFEDIAEMLKNRLYENDKLHINDLEDLTVTFNDRGEFIVTHCDETDNGVQSY